MPHSRFTVRLTLGTLLSCLSPAARAVSLLDSGPPIHIAWATGAIEVDDPEPAPSGPSSETTTRSAAACPTAAA